MDHYRKFPFNINNIVVPQNFINRNVAIFRSKLESVPFPLPFDIRALQIKNAFQINDNDQ